MEKIIETIGSHADIDTRLGIEHVTGINLHKKVVVPRLKIPVTPYLFRHLPDQRLVIYVDVLNYTFGVCNDIEPRPNGYWSPCYTIETWECRPGEYVTGGAPYLYQFQFAGQPEIISE